MDAFLLKVGDTGQRVRDMQWLLAGHNRYGIQTYWDAVDGDFGYVTGRAAAEMKRRIGYPPAGVVPTAGSELRGYLLPMTSDGAKRRPAAYIARARQAAPKTGYPLARTGQIIGVPYQGTHTRGNWESDRACDIAVPIGTPVLACFPGVIGPQFGPLSSHDPLLLGLRFHLVGASDEAYYAHLSSFAEGISPGDHVQTGELIGRSGAANGVAHLHFALRVGWPPTFLAAGDT